LPSDWYVSQSIHFWFYQLVSCGMPEGVTSNFRATLCDTSHSKCFILQFLVCNFSLSALWNAWTNNQVTFLSVPSVLHKVWMHNNFNSNLSYVWSHLSHLIATYLLSHSINSTSIQTSPPPICQVSYVPLMHKISS
jgi:hypothetical protein